MVKNTFGVERIVPLTEKCHGNNHFASVCLKTKQRVHAIDDEDADDSGSEDESQSEYVLEISNKKKQNKRIMANIKMQGKIIKFQIDSGSTVNVIPRSIAGDDN